MVSRHIYEVLEHLPARRLSVPNGAYAAVRADPGSLQFCIIHTTKACYLTNQKVVRCRLATCPAEHGLQATVVPSYGYARVGSSLSRSARAGLSVL